MSATTCVPSDVVADRLERVRLHQRHVLVRRRVEDDARPVALEDLCQLRPVADVGEDGDAGRELPLVHELALDLEERRLALVERISRAGFARRDLAAELRADRAAGARDQHGLALEIRRDRLEVDLDRLAAEDVLHLHRADLRGEVDLVGDQLVEARQRLHRNALAARASTTCWRCSPEADGIAIRSSSGRLSRRTCAELVRGPEHADAVDAEVPLARVVVDDPDRRVAELRVASASP